MGKLTKPIVHLCAELTLILMIVPEFGILIQFLCFKLRYDMETETKRKILQSFEDFEAWARQKATERPEQHREGQFIYNLLYMSFPEQVELLGYCGIDCFHNDSMIHPFLMELSKMNSLISLISNRVVEVFSDYGLKATILKVNISYQVYSFELKIEKRTSRRKINEVAYSLNKKYLEWNKNIRVDFSASNPTLEVGVSPLPYQIHTRNIFHEPDFNSQLPIILGIKTIDGKALQFDLSASGNILIGGATKQGKSTCIKNMIYCLERCESKPDIILFDPKKYEFDDYKDKYKVCYGAAQLGRLAVSTVITRMNQKDTCKFPPLVIIIDEYTDLFQDNICSIKEMIRSSRITQIAQWGPMVNVHLIISTNRTERIFFPPELTDNIKTRISFRTISVLDSKQIIGAPGAESLLGCGDGLYACSGQLTRFQGTIG